VGPAADERAFSELKRLCYAGLDGPELLGRVIARLRQTVPFEAYCASTLDPSSGLITHATAAEMWGEKESSIFLDHLYFKYDVDEFKRMARRRRPIVLLSESTGGMLERSPRYRELIGPMGLGHEARAVFTADEALWGSMDLTREVGRPDFKPREVALLRRVSIHLGPGLKAAALRSQSSPEENRADIPGVLTIDKRGQVVQHTWAAEHWLRELGDLRPGWREGAGLPAAVRMVAGVLKRALKPETDKDLNSAPRLRVRGRSGRWLTLYGSLSEFTSGRSGETVIVIEPAKPEEDAWLNVASYGLSPREEEVIKLVLKGATTKQISAMLHISEYTVQNHLSHVFDKVGVRSRSALVKRLFFENLYPALLG
jgi:DNA-binding CsgD family transcriptional regulator